MRPSVLVPLALGLFVGALAGWTLHPSAEPVPSDVVPSVDRAPEAAHAADTRKVEEVGSPSAPVLHPRPASTASTPGASPDRADVRPVDDAAGPPTTPARRAALIAARAESIRRRAADSIRQANDLDVNAEEIATRMVDAELDAERTRLADLAHGGLLDLVRELGKDWTPPQALLSAAASWAPYFEVHATGARMDPARAGATPEAIRPGDVIQVPSGVSTLDVRAMNRAFRTGGFPEDLVVEGLGMDSSLLVLNDEFDVGSDVVNLTFRYLTVHCNDNYFVEFRHGFTLRLDHCRVIGFDMGAGGSTAFNGTEGALYASACRIESGFGRAPYRGNLWRVDGTFLARLEDCTIVGPIGDVTLGSSDLIVYDRTTFVDLTPTLEANLRSQQQGVLLVDCRFEHSPGLSAVELWRREPRGVSELNPAWEMAKDWR